MVLQYATIYQIYEFLEEFAGLMAKFVASRYTNQL